jgi:uncharacterized damage-inducible protein DinB
MNPKTLAPLCLALALAPAAWAHDDARTAAAAPASAPPPAAGSAREEALKNFDDAAGKLERLAEAIPADKFGWRPAEGVRSVSEVLLHVSTGNFGIPVRLGGAAPEGLDLRTLEKSTQEKAKVIEIVKRANDNVRKTFQKVKDADLEKTSEWFDKSQITQRAVMNFIASHNHEHLGQLIAYARMNGVTPPWSAGN